MKTTGTAMPRSAAIKIWHLWRIDEPDDCDEVTEFVLNATTLQEAQTIAYDDTHHAGAWFDYRCSKWTELGKANPGQVVGVIMRCTQSTNEIPHD